MSGDQHNLDERVRQTAADLVKAGFFPDTALAAAALVEAMTEPAQQIEKHHP